MSESFLFYDLETFGTDPRRTRIAQFAAIRTTPDLEEIEEPIDLKVQPADDLLPSPGASLVTGLTPQALLRDGVNEAAAFARIAEEMGRPAPAAPATTRCASTTNSSATGCTGISTIPTSANGAEATRAGTCWTPCA